MGVKFVHLDENEQPIEPPVAELMNAAVEASTIGYVDARPEPRLPDPPVVLTTTFDTPDNVEYDIKLPDGGTETYSTAGPSTNQPVPDAMLLAQRRLAQLKILHQLIRQSKRSAKNAEAAKGRKIKSRKKRDLQKASRKRNR